MSAHLAMSALDSAAKSASQLFSYATNANTADDSYVNPRCFLDLQIGGRRAGRLLYLPPNTRPLPARARAC